MSPFDFQKVYQTLETSVATDELVDVKRLLPDLLPQVNLPDTRRHEPVTPSVEKSESMNITEANVDHHNSVLR